VDKREISERYTEPLAGDKLNRVQKEGLGNHHESQRFPQRGRLVMQNTNMQKVFNIYTAFHQCAGMRVCCPNWTPQNSNCSTMWD